MFEFRLSWHQSSIAGKIKLLTTEITLLVVLNGCQQINSVTSPEVHPGMKMISSKGVSVTLGSTAAASQVDEHPACTAEFTYDFFIDSTEVTIADYHRVTGTLPREYDTALTSDSLCPVCHVSWFDAIRYCNERSRRDNLDSVYTYYAVERAQDGDIMKLAGFRAEYHRNGYRLPTEAEWVVAARGSANEEYLWGENAPVETVNRYAWYNGNAGQKAHPVARLAPNSNGLYDMAGNASEWVTDTKIPFDGSHLYNFVGGNNDATSTKVLKGGCYALDIVNLRVATRSDPYPVDAVTRSRYIGFRCAAGTIAKPEYGTEHVPVDTESVTVINSLLLPFAGTYSAKLAFVNSSGARSRKLCVLDYTKQPACLVQYPESTDVYAPVISPDGNWVAWTTNEVGAVNRGAIFVRSLIDSGVPVRALPDTPAFIPRWHVSPSMGDTSIIYVSTARMNDQVAWLNGQTKKMIFRNGAFSGIPEVLDDHGAYHGGISGDEQFLVTGYPYLRTKNRSTSDGKTLFYAPNNGKTGTDTSQVCNVSIAPGKQLPPQILFLDFGSGSGGSTLTNSVYSMHEYVFRATIDGMVLDFYHVPAPFASWNHVEWSNHPRYAVGCAVTEQGASRLVYLIDLERDTAVPLCDGLDLRDPSLWIKPGSDTVPFPFSLDSIGQYDNPHICYQQSWVADKLKTFWKHASSLEAAIIGTSVATDGINPQKLTCVKSINMGIVSGDLSVKLALIHDYVLPHAPKLRAIVLGLDPYTFQIPDNSEAAYISLTQSKGYAYDASHGFWTNGVSPQLVTAMTTVDHQQTETFREQNNTDSLGFTTCECIGWGPSPPPVFVAADASFDTLLYQRHLEELHQVLRECLQRGVKVLLVNVPFHPGYVQTGVYGAYGPSWQNAQRILDAMKDIDDKEPDLVFYDANNNGNPDYTETDFVDYYHLCSNGADKLTHRVDSLLQVMLK